MSDVQENDTSMIDPDAISDDNLQSSVDSEGNQESTPESEGALDESSSSSNDPENVATSSGEDKSFATDEGKTGKRKKRVKQPAITIEDVRNALKDESGNSANPYRVTLTAVRERIGYGSYATISKHLATLRAEVDLMIETPMLDVPPAPADVTSMLWKAAWESVRGIFLAQHSELSAKNERLRDQHETMSADIVPVLDELSRIEGELVKRDALIEQMKSDSQEEIERHAQEVAEIQGKLNESRTQIKTLTELIKDHITPA